MEKYDFSGWATKNDLLCADGRTIRKDAFKGNDGQKVPLVWNHDHDDPDRILGHALLENREEGVYAYCFFNNGESAKAAKEAVKHGDVRSLSIYANKLKQAGSDVLHGLIREVSIVMSGANPGAFIDYVMAHGEDTEEGLILGYDENIMIHHYTEVEETPHEEPLQHAENNKEEKKVETAEEPKAESKEETVQDVLNTLTEKQQKVVYGIIGMMLEEEDGDDEDDTDNENTTAKHSEGGNELMHKNVFENDNNQDTTFLTHSDQMEIISAAKTAGSFKKGVENWGNDHLQHGFDTTGDDAISLLFPDYKDVHPGAPELLERDHDWVGTVMSKAKKSPAARVRTRQVDARAKAMRAKGYSNREEEKALSANVKLLMRNTDPQTVYYRDTLHRDDIIDLDFDVISYQKGIMERALKEEVALAAMVGDGREDTDPDKISEDHIRPIWHDADLYTIKAPVDLAGMRTKLQGTNTGANFGEEYIFTESVIAASLHAREQYKGKGTPDFFCTPHTLNVMLLARDLNGRRIYDTKTDIAKALNVGNIFTVEQFANLEPRENADGDKFNLLGLFVNMANYQFGSTKGGEITSFEDFDIDFSAYKYLLETRLSGALTEVYSAIALEEPVEAASDNEVSG